MSKTLSERLLVANDAIPLILKSIPELVVRLNNMGLATVDNPTIFTMKQAGTFTPQMEALVKEIDMRYRFVLASNKDLSIVDLGDKITNRLIIFFDTFPDYDYILKIEFDAVLKYLDTL